MSLLKNWMPRLLIPALLLLFFCHVLYDATAQEDSYITFRVVDNIVHGEGMRWNLDERVQVFTHPLWMLIHVPFYAVWRDIYLVTLMISLVCTGGVFWLVLRTFSPSRRAAACAFIMPLFFCWPYVLFSASGFENPLLHVIFAGFGFVLWRAPGKYSWFWLSVLTSLSAVTRLDTLVFYAPIWLFLLASRRREVGVRQILLGMLPLVAWELFSVFYFGMFSPNTRYAKLQTGADESYYLRMGLGYYYNMLLLSPVSAVLIVGASLGSLPLGWRYLRKGHQKAGIMCAVGLGVLAYSLYVYWVGGTYLTGRLSTLPMLASAWVLLGVCAFRSPPKWVERWTCFVALLWCFYPTWKDVLDVCPVECFYGVGPPAEIVFNTFPKYLLGLHGPPQPRAQPYTVPVIEAGSIGIWGYVMPRQMKIIDHIGIADALIARLPIKYPYLSSMGNLPREMPEGYMHAQETGDVSQMDPDLAAYYVKLRLIISGDLWDPERLREIVRFNLGDYDALLKRYNDKHTPFTQH